MVVRVELSRRLAAKELMPSTWGAGEDLWESLVQQRRSNQSILKEISPEYSLERLMLKLQYFGHLMRRAYSLEKTLMLGKTEGRRRRERHRMRWLDGITDLMDMSLSRTPGVVDGQGGLACCDSWVTKSWTRLSDWTELNLNVCLIWWSQVGCLWLVVLRLLFLNLEAFQLKFGFAYRSY